MSGAPDPFTRAADGLLILDGVLLPVSGRCVRLAIRDDKIEALPDCPGPPRWVCLPPLVDKHVHACRAYSLAGHRQPRSLEDGIRLLDSALAQLTAADFCDRSLRLFHQALANGSTGLRTHTDVSVATGLRAVEGVCTAREQAGGSMNIEIVAFATAGSDPAEKTVQDHLRAAVGQGADLLGAVPDFYTDPQRSVYALLELAGELDVDVDLHLDEHLDVSAMLSETVSRAVLRHDYCGRVTLSHGCVLSVLEDTRRREVIDGLAEAGITVIALPHTNLYLQDRDSGPVPRRRGLTAVNDLIRAGVPVRIASDNVRDPVYPFGNADLLEAAWLAVITGHLLDTAAIIAAVCDGRTEVTAGAGADLVLIPAADLNEALASRGGRRVVVTAGRPGPF